MKNLARVKEKRRKPNISVPPLLHPSHVLNTSPPVHHIPGAATVLAPCSIVDNVALSAHRPGRCTCIQDVVQKFRAVLVEVGEALRVHHTWQILADELNTNL